MTMCNLVFIADSELSNCRTTQHFFEKEGFHVECFETGDQLYEAFQQKKCAFVILGTVASGNDGFIVGAKIRQVSDVPIIILAAQESDENYIFCMSLGMDAYLIKPITAAKLVTHVRALLIRAELRNNFHVSSPEKETDMVLQFADISICPSKVTTYCKDKEIRLTTTEFKLLVFMFENQDRVIVRNEFVSKLWDNDSVKIRAVDDVVKRLRKKLSDSASRVAIETVWGHGFKLGVRAS